MSHDNLRNCCETSDLISPFLPRHRTINSHFSLQNPPRRTDVRASILTLIPFSPWRRERFLRFYPYVVRSPFPPIPSYREKRSSCFYPLRRIFLRREEEILTLLPPMSKPSFSAVGKTFSRAALQRETQEREKLERAGKRKDFGTVFSMPTWPTGLSIHRVTVFGRARLIFRKIAHVLPASRSLVRIRKGREGERKFSGD